MSQTIAALDTSRGEKPETEACTGNDSDARQRDFVAEHALRVETVDAGHPAWQDVLRAIGQAGERHILMLNENGRLSARQTLLVAFARDQVIGHLCFRVEPFRAEMGRTTVRAKLDSFAVDKKFAGSPVERLLADTAEERARLMRCRSPRVDSFPHPNLGRASARLNSGVAC